MLNRASKMEKKSFEAFLQDVSNKELKIKKKEVESFLLKSNKICIILLQDLI
jgi:hypothetical protein